VSWDDPRYEPDGPWAVDEDNEGKITVYVADESRDICDIVIDDDVEGCVAIGHLVAATPELLMALKKLVERIELWNSAVRAQNRNLNFGDIELDEARAAIAKAEWRRKRIRHNRNKGGTNA
jgi:hypothetical protein